MRQSTHAKMRIGLICANSPINLVDPSGLDPNPFIDPSTIVNPFDNPDLSDLTVNSGSCMDSSPMSGPGTYDPGDPNDPLNQPLPNINISGPVNPPLGPFVTYVLVGGVLVAVTTATAGLDLTALPAGAVIVEGESAVGIITPSGQVVAIIGADAAHGTVALEIPGALIAPGTLAPGFIPFTVEASEGGVLSMNGISGGFPAASGPLSEEAQAILRAYFQVIPP
jgi:hypothetical protein